MRPISPPIYQSEQRQFPRWPIQESIGISITNKPIYEVKMNVFVTSRKIMKWKRKQEHILIDSVSVERYIWDIKHILYAIEP